MLPLLTVTTAHIIKKAGGFESQQTSWIRSIMVIVSLQIPEIFSFQIYHLNVLIKKFTETNKMLAYRQVVSLRSNISIY